MNLKSLFRRRQSKREQRRGLFHHALYFEQLENRLVLADADDQISEALMLGAISTTANTVSASISPDTDVNMVTFSVTAGQVVDFDIDTPNNGPGGLGTYLRLFNAAGTQLGANNDGMAPGENNLGFDSYFRFTFTTAGTYFLATSNYNNVQYNPVTGDGDFAGGLYTIGSYSLFITGLPIDLNDSIAEATSIGVVTSSMSTVSSNLVTDIDVNMVSFTVIAGQIVDFDVDTPNNGPGGLGSYIRLFNAQGTQLAFNNDGTAPGENALGFDSYLRYTFATAGTYFLGVSNFNNFQYDPLTGDGDWSGGAYSIGSYQLLVQSAAIVVPDPNDSISEATALGIITTTPITISSSLTVDTDVNMVSFNVTPGQIIDFDIDTALNGIGGLGSFIRLFDASGTQLTFNNDGLSPGESALGFDAYLRYSFATSGTFFIGVSNYNNVQYNPATGDGDTTGGLNTTGSYQLTIVALPIDTDDSISEATNLGAVSSTVISVSKSLVTDIDVNMVAFTVSAGQIVDFDIDTPLNGPGGLGSYIRLFNSAGQPLAFNNDAAAPGESIVGYDAYLRYTFVTSGTYYLGVSNLNNIQYDPSTGNGDTAGGLHSIGSYQLLIQSPAVVVPDPNDTIAEAVSLGTITTAPISVSSTIAPDTDVNMVSFSVTAGQVIDFDIDTALNGTGGLGSYIRLFDAFGTQLAFNNDGLAPGESRVGFDAYLRYTFANAGTYYLGVSNLNNILYNPTTGEGDSTGGQNTIGTYALTVQGLPIDRNDSISEALALGPVSTTAIIVNASMVTDIDVNMVSFFVSAGQIVDFDIDTALNGTGGLDSLIRLFNAQGQQLSFNNDATAPGETVLGFDSYLRYAFATGGTYFLGVSNVNNEQYDPTTGNGDSAGGFNSIGSYQLIVQTSGAVVVDPNDAISEAAALGAISASPTTINSSISPDTDVNMVGFTVTAGQVVDFDIDTTANGPGGLGSYIRLFDGSGTQLAFNNDATAPGEGALGLDAYLRYTFAIAGAYFLGVSNSNNTVYDPVTGTGDTSGGTHATGSYQLIIQTAAAVLSDPNDSISEATPIGAISATAITVNASISPDTDVNMIGFTVTAGQVVDFDLDTPLNGTGGLSSYIRLFNAQGTQLAFNNDGLAPGEATPGFDAYLRYTFATAGAYYLGVSNSINVAYDPVTGNGDTAGGANKTGNYQLIVQTAPAVTTDPNDAISEAAGIGTVSTTPIHVNSSISPDTDVNMVSFAVAAGQVVDFDMDTTLNGAGGLGSYIRLFDAQGTQLAFNDNGVAPGESALGFDAYLRYAFASAGTYYLGVSNSNNVTYDPATGSGDIAGGQNSVGSYQLSVEAAAVILPDPNDSITEATDLGAISTNPIMVSASISPDTDVNIVAFTVHAGQIIDFDIDTALNGSSGLGSYIRLFDAQGTQLAFNNDGSAPGENVLGLDAYLRYTFATAGTFYLSVSNSNNVLYDPVSGEGDTAGGSNATGSYQLVILALPIDTNDSISEATPIGTISASPITVNASLVTDVDVNMVSFSVTAGQLVNFDIDTVLNGPGGLGSFVRLFNAFGQQLASNNNAAAPGESFIGFDSYLRYTFLTAGTYYLGVSNSNNTLYDPISGDGDAAGGFYSTGNYQLIVQSTTAVLSDPDDTIAEAHQVGSITLSPITVNNNISPDTDVNMVGFTVVAGQLVDFDIDTTQNGPGGLGSYLRLFDDQGLQLATAGAAAATDESVVGYDAYLRFNFTTTGTYYVGVSNANNILYDSITGVGDLSGGANATGGYQLNIQAATISTTDVDDSIPEAIALGAISAIPISVDFAILPDVDVDMYSFVVKKGQIVDMDIDTDLNGSTGLNSYLRVFDATGQLLHSNNDAIAPGESVLGFDAYLRHTFLDAGTYFVGVSNNTNNLYDAVTGNGDVSGGAKATGNYRLILRSLSTTLNLSINKPSISEHNGTATGTVNRTGADLTGALIVNLQSSDVGSLNVPTSVVIPAGQSTAAFSIAALDDHVVSGTKVVTITGAAIGFSTGAANINILDSDSLWHNVNNPLDVDGDISVSPLDVLMIINYLNLKGSGPVSSSAPPPYLDVDSDNYVSPLDVLIVINYLNRQGNGQGEGESQSMASPESSDAVSFTAAPIESIDEYFARIGRKRTIS